MGSIDWEKNYYKILGISSKSSIDEINKRYKYLARLNHPDINKNVDENYIRELNEAHDVLCNRISKALYDRNCIFDLVYEDIKQGLINDEVLEENPNIENELYNDTTVSEKLGNLKKRVSKFLSGETNFLSNDKYNNPYVPGSSYIPDYQRALDGKNTILDLFDKEIHYLNAFKRDLKENKYNLISYDCDTVRTKLSLPFFKKGINLLNVYNLNLKNDSEYLNKIKKVKICLYETLYIFARLLENRSYSTLYSCELISKCDFYIEKAEELYSVLFDLLGMTTSEALFSDIIFKSIKKQPKEEQVYMKMKYEICLCYVSFRKLCEKKEKEKQLIKTK